MKQIYNQTVLIVLMLIVSIAVHAQNAQTVINGITYALNDETKTASVKSADDYSLVGKVVIPETINHNGNSYKVVEIASGAFSNTYSITSVVIPNSVTRIEDYAFDNCYGLENITIPEAVKNIEHRTFMNCSKLTEINLPSSLESIDYEAFWGCKSLKNINLPKTLNYIGSQTFNGCTSLLSIEIPEKVTKIQGATFQDCYSLKEVKLPENLVEIESHAFYFCQGLTTITIPASVRKIGENAFDGCRLNVLNNYSPAPQIIDYTSNYKPVINTVHVPEGFTSYYKKADFWGIYNIIDDLKSPYVALTSNGINLSLDTNTKTAMALGYGDYSGDVVIPSTVDYNGDSYKVTSIFDRTFYNCNEMVSVTIPEYVIDLGPDPFTMCKKLQTIYLHPRTAPSYFGTFFEGSQKIHIPTGYIDAYESGFGWYDYGFIDDIPSNFIKTDISGLRYYLNTDNGEAKVTNNGTFIQGDVIIPSIVSYQNKDYIVKSITKNAFIGCTLKSITIPNTITEIHSLSFDCCGIEKINLMSTLPPNYEFYGLYDKELHIPLGYKRDYLKSPYWAQFTIIDDILNDNVATVEDNGLIYNIDPSINFVKLAGTKTPLSGDIVIPEKITYNGTSYNVNMIGFQAFADCNDITSITIPRSVSDIDYGAFAECFRIKDVFNYAFIPQLSLGNMFFEYQFNVHVPKDCGNIYSKADEWELCNIIEDLPNETFVKVEEGPLTYYVDLESKEAKFTSGKTPYGGDIVIAPSIVYNNEIYPVTAIVEGALKYDSEITSLSIPASVSEIHHDTFLRADKLKTITNYSPTPQTVYYQKGSHSQSGVVYVPAGSMDIYKHAKFWSPYNIEELAVSADATTAKAVTDMIASIGAPENTASYKEKIATARAAYAALTKEQQAWVPNFNLLVKAEISYNDLVADIVDINTVQNIKNVNKYIENGKVIIVRDGKKFNTVGLQQ